MRRRNFIRQTVTAGSSLLAPTALLAGAPITVGDSGRPFRLNYAFHDGMFKDSAGKDFSDQIRYGYDLGFRAIEDNGMMDRTPADQEKIGNLLTKLNMSMGVFVHAFDHWPVSTSLCSGDAAWREKFIKYTKDAIDVSKDVQEN
jgi:hydroxypyruvate isomerase